MPNSMANIDILYQNQVKTQSAFAQYRTVLNSASEQNCANLRKVRLLMIGTALVMVQSSHQPEKNNVS